MESLGQKLREAREAHSYSVEQIARDTHISKQYLEALELENFSALPGDTYVVGFLRNYAEYLGLDPEELVTLYKNIRIQEQPMPMSELLQRPRRRPPPRILLALLALVLVGVGVFLVVRFLLPRGPAAAASEKPRAVATEAGYVLKEEAITRWFNQDETIDVPLATEQYRIRLAAVGDRLTLRVPGGTVELAVNQERLVDLDGDGRNDIRIQLNDLDVTASARRANLSLYKLTKGPGEEAGPVAGQAAGQPAGAGELSGAAASAGAAPAGTAPGAAPAAAAPAGPAAAAPAASTPAAPVPAEPPVAAPAAIVASGAPLDLESASAPSPFRISISFRGYCLLRYLADNDSRDERFFHKGETFALDAKQEVRLWVSNAGALRLSVAGKDMELGRAGEVVTRTLKWTESQETGGYRLQLLASD
jgi:cytoskeleton protein RodZ